MTLDTHKRVPRRYLIILLHVSLQNDLFRRHCFPIHIGWNFPGLSRISHYWHCAQSGIIMENSNTWIDLEIFIQVRNVSCTVGSVTWWSMIDITTLLACNVRQLILHQVSYLALSKSVTLHPHCIYPLELTQINIFKSLRAIISGYYELSWQ